MHITGFRMHITVFMMHTTRSRMHTTEVRMYTTELSMIITGFRIYTKVFRMQTTGLRMHTTAFRMHAKGFLNAYHWVQGAAKEFRFPEAEFRKQLNFVQEEALSQEANLSLESSKEIPGGIIRRAVGQQPTKLCEQLHVLAKIL
jgi:hypothetical protein